MLLLNPYLSPHVHTLIEAIKKRSIIQYVTPFSSVRLGVMAQAFGLNDQEMLLQVEGLVEGKEIHGRIDLVDLVCSLDRDLTDAAQVLEMKSPDARAELFTSALRMGKESSDTTRAALLRMRLCVYSSARDC